MPAAQIFHSLPSARHVILECSELFWSLQVSLNTMSILQSYYPERLGLALCYHPPALFSFTWKARALNTLAVLQADTCKGLWHLPVFSARHNLRAVVACDSDAHCAANVKC